MKDTVGTPNDSNREEPQTRRWWPVVRSVASARWQSPVWSCSWPGWAGRSARRFVPARFRCRATAPPAAPPRVVEKVRAEDAATAVGSVQPRRRTEVAASCSLRILDVKVRPGDAVHARAGTPVLLDDRELLAQQGEAEAAVTAAEADLVDPQGGLTRTRRTPRERGGQHRRVRPGRGGVPGRRGPGQAGEGGGRPARRAADLHEDSARPRAAWSPTGSSTPATSPPRASRSWSSTTRPNWSCTPTSPRPSPPRFAAGQEVRPADRRGRAQGRGRDRARGRPAGPAGEPVRCW